jgi:4-aminobutyrate aminotransferase-like enzyme
MAMHSLPPLLTSEIPGPRSRDLAVRLAKAESRNITCLVPEAPIFWERAAGANVWDVDGNRYVDLGGAFGVCNAGHAHPRVLEAIAEQSARLLHGMGDVHPSAVKVDLLEALVAIDPGRGPARAVLGTSGSDAVEIAIKTALLATGRSEILAFEGGYHGLSFGALDTTWRNDFRAPFAARLPHATHFAPYGDSDAVARIAKERGDEIAAVIVEPIQGRGGERVPPAGFLADLRARCDELGWLLIVDEIYTGFGRTGRWFACESEDVVPDLMCVGKGLASGMPISACLGTARVMDAWPTSTGEALHTQTFLGHPASCAAALASMRVIAEEKLAEHASDVGARALAYARERLGANAQVADIRGQGLMLGIECERPERSLEACRFALEHGVILLPSGDDGRVLSITPPLCIESELLHAALDVLAESLA